MHHDLTRKLKIASYKNITHIKQRPNILKTKDYIICIFKNQSALKMKLKIIIIRKKDITRNYIKSQRIINQNNTKTNLLFECNRTQI